jgi:hypothetical protein
VSPRLAVAPPAHRDDVLSELARELETLAGLVAERGTGAARSQLEAVAQATRDASPGAAAALVDPAATETLRLRAFGVLHGVALHELDRERRAALLAGLRSTQVRRMEPRVA